MTGRIGEDLDVDVPKLLMSRCVTMAVEIDVVVTAVLMRDAHTGLTAYTR